MPNPLIQTLRQGYTWRNLSSDLIAGLTVGIIALPLAMALAIASGVPPQYGLYTAIIAGAIIAITGGSRYSVSGPTAAFVVILLPITNQYGLGGLLIATVMAGIILLLMGWLKLGRLIQYIPIPVTLGFTAGIAVVIVSLQLKDFFGLADLDNNLHFFAKLQQFFTLLPSISWGDFLVGLFTLGFLIAWPRLRLPIPGHLPAILLGTALAVAFTYWSALDITFLGDQFQWTNGDETGRGIPPFLPSFAWPWQMPNAEGMPIGLSWQLINDLLPAALSVALLGAIESLLCAVIADSITQTRHNPNKELIGQGLGNVIVPFFGGITATAALARTAANIKAGAFSPMAAIFHSLAILVFILLFAELLSWLPMASLAALLLVVAWHMSEARRFTRLVKIAPRDDVIVLLACFGLTVIFDMVVAVTVGIILAALFFIGRMTKVTQAKLSDSTEKRLMNLPDTVAYINISGPLFFGVAEKIVHYFERFDEEVDSILIDMSQVATLDITAIDNLYNALKKLDEEGKLIILIGLVPDIMQKVERTRIVQELQLEFATTPTQAIKVWRKYKVKQAEEELAEQAELEAENLEQEPKSKLENI